MDALFSFLYFHMRTFRIVPLFASLMLLSACTASVSDQDIDESVTDTVAPFAREQVYVDPAQSEVSFVGQSNIINHPGKFNRYDATMTLDALEPQNLEKAKFDLVLYVDSIETDTPMLDGHLQKEDFFDVENYPEVTFTSTSIVKTSDTTYDITGDLTAKGKTMNVTISNAVITNDGLDATFNLPRREFSIGNDSYGDKFLDPTVPVTIKLVFTDTLPTDDAVSSEISSEASSSSEAAGVDIEVLE
jgi:polyisoprenoid-binding protein YceI